VKLIRLGKTGLMVTNSAMGCLPVQRCSMEDGVRLIRAAYEGGINYFDTANAYTDSEEKVGLALHDVRDHVIISTKSQARDKKCCAEHIDNSLKMLKTDHIDLFQFHQCPELPDPDDPDGAFAAALEAKAQGKILHIGITTHRVNVAEDAIASGNFETLQFPFSYISSDRDLALAGKCRQADMGFIAMKGLAGGLLTNARACRAFMSTYGNVVPIWGIQTMDELTQWLRVTEEDPSMDEELAAAIKRDRSELAGSFCRSCGYCMPCTVGIEIRNCARMNMLLRRSPWRQYMTPEWRAKMDRINDCIGCRKCAEKCPYQLDTPNVLKYMLKDYYEFYEAHKNEL
jgi:predicted aldo/keto reductase-like oxidoreductase